MNHILKKRIEAKSILWLENSNQYLMLENLTADIVCDLAKNISVDVLAGQLENKIEVSFEKAVNFILDIEAKILKTVQKNKPFSFARINYCLPSSFDFVKHYKINNKIFKIQFATEFELLLIHPKFAHLEVSYKDKPHFYFEIFTQKNHTFLLVDGTLIGNWKKEDIHYFQGKFSMELIQKFHQKSEDEWMGVFHASAVSNDKKAILFLGNSGNGKSTSLALLQANGYTCLADDFVPIDSEKREVYSFPASISIKKNSVEALLPFYPELETSVEYHFKRLKKCVRYLKPVNDNFGSHLPCKELIFIKYDKGSELQFAEISKTEAFQKLVPDSWLSPKKENAAIFLNWFQNLKCYQITYSDNQKMINTVSEIFNDEL